MLALLIFTCLFYLIGCIHDKLVKGKRIFYLKLGITLASLFCALIISFESPLCSNILDKEEHSEKFPQSHLDIIESTNTKPLPVNIPKYLSCSPKKDWLYAQDPFFRIGFDSLQKICSDPHDFCENYTYLIIKPDGIAARCFENTIHYLECNQFKICNIDLIHFDSTKSVLFWFYESNFFPVEWFSLNDLLFSNQPCIILLLKDVSLFKNESASVRLKQLKGHTFANSRKPFQLRSALGAGSGFLTFVHTPDDALSMLREWAIVMDSAKRDAFILGYKKDPSSAQELDKVKELAYSKIASHALDYALVVKNLEKLCLSLPLSSEVKNEFTSMLYSDYIDFQKICLFIKRHKIEIPHWDLITLCAYKCGGPLPVFPLIE